MLTDAHCRNASCPPGKKRERLTDTAGLYMEVSPNGSKRWFQKLYREGKETRMALGSYPAVGLTAVRVPTLYGLKKRVYFAMGIQDRMATTSMPVLPPSKDVERWGVQGANDGLVDYKATTGKLATNYGNALSALASEGKRYN